MIFIILPFLKQKICQKKIRQKVTYPSSISRIPTHKVKTTSKQYHKKYYCNNRNKLFTFSYPIFKICFHFYFFFIISKINLRLSLSRAPNVKVINNMVKQIPFIINNKKLLSEIFINCIASYKTPPIITYGKKHLKRTRQELIFIFIGQ